MSGRSPSTRSAAPSNFAVVSCPAANRNVAVRTTSTTSGVEPSGYFAVAIEVSTSSRGASRRSSMYWENFSSAHASGLVAITSWSRPPMFVPGQLGAEGPAELLVVGFGDAEQVGNDQAGRTALRMRRGTRSGRRR